MTPRAARSAAVAALVAMLAPCAATGSAQVPTPGAPTSAQTPGARDEDVEREFQALLARVKQSDATVDFARLRRLSVATAGYDPRAGADEGAMLAAAAVGNFPKALALARSVLTRNYLSLDAHFAADAACRAAQDTPCSDHHHYVAQGILNSIGASGNGQTPATAYVVVSQGEEMAVARVLGLDVREQTLLEDQDGHTLDVVSGRDDAGAERQLFFNVDLPLAALKRAGGGRAPAAP